MILAVGFLLNLTLASAFEIPEAVYPMFPKHAASAKGFTPPGWEVEVNEAGDLNGDGKPDLLLVFHQDDPAFIVKNDPDSPGEDEIDTNPRILVVAFACAGGDYDLVLENRDFIPRYEEPTLDDPFNGAEIADGGIVVHIHFWANAGTWYTDDRAFTFRFIDGAFRLVGYTDFTTKRNTGETWELKMDYTTCSAEFTVGSFSDDDVTDKTYRSDLPKTPLETIDDIGSGEDFRCEQQDPYWWGIGDTED